MPRYVREMCVYSVFGACCCVGCQTGSLGMLMLGEYFSIFGILIPFLKFLNVVENVGSS